MATLTLPNGEQINIADNLSEEEKQDLTQLPLEPLNKLRILEFMSLYNEDGMAHIIKNTEFWLKDTFTRLTYDT